ncbi:MAG: imidazoleglycerol-phosphate dehydratase HisB [Clostridia bacterium]|nr:imidazoleglycerol-phosphate dehydratase HisB [Clostridia bacterium]
MRTAEIARQTLETKIELALNLDGEGKAEVATGIGFLDHMLVLLAKHAFLDLTIKASGDLEVDSHHTVEDCGIVLGQALKKAVGDKTGMHRYGSCFLPMDEALAHVVLDFSGRPILVWQAEIPKVTLGNLEAEMVEEFFRALAAESGMTLHVRLLYGRNTHHIIEAIFKAFARALAEGVAIDSRVKGVMSSKGKL